MVAALGRDHIAAPRARGRRRWREPARCRRQAARGGLVRRPGTHVLLLDRARTDTDATVRIAALSAIAIGWRDHPETRPLLRHHQAGDPDTTVRDHAGTMIALGWPET